jgi:hypothetical protein
MTHPIEDIDMGGELAWERKVEVIQLLCEHCKVPGCRFLMRSPGDWYVSVEGLDILWGTWLGNVNGIDLAPCSGRPFFREPGP